MQFDYVSKVITHSKLWVGSIFLKCHFFLSNVHHSFAKLERILMLMIKTSKGVENFGEIQFYNTFEHLWVKYVFGLKNHDF
jgi:hypothetical protein